MSAKYAGVMAALPTPRSADGEVDFGAIRRNAGFVLDRGVQGIVPCGGTGEYFDLSLSQRFEIVEQLTDEIGGHCPLIVGIGAARISESIRLAQHAFDSGADAVLLPSPYFFRYGDAEVLQFFREAARKIGGPVLLYNLPGFVSPIAADVVVELLQSETSLVGIKDSSGTLEILRRLTDEGIPCTRIQGHDLRVPESLREGLLDGAISGPASVVPEMTKSLFESVGDAGAFARAVRFNDEFLDQFARFPYPWALKWIATWRGLGPATLPFSLNAEQERAKNRFREWFEKWLSRLKTEISRRAA